MESLTNTNTTSAKQRIWKRREKKEFRKQKEERRKETGARHTSGFNENGNWSLRIDIDKQE